MTHNIIMIKYLMVFQLLSQKIKWLSFPQRNSNELGNISRSSDTNIEEIPAKRVSKEKREKIVCGCKGDCARKICGCKKAGRLCDRAYCKCSADKCQNKSPEDDKENDFTSVETVTIEKGDIPNLDVSTIGLGSHRDTVNFELFLNFR